MCVFQTELEQNITMESILGNKTLEMRSSVSAKGVWQCLQL